LFQGRVPILPIFFPLVFETPLLPWTADGLREPALCFIPVLLFKLLIFIRIFT
jgi:hypothetical protein